MPVPSETEAVSVAEALVPAAGRYLYCVAEAGQRVSLGAIGIAGREVYTIPCTDLGAVVHDCLAQPYQSAETETVQAWVVAHHRVVEEAWQRWGTVLPVGFDTIIKAEAGRSAEQQVQEWLQREYAGLKAKLERLRGKEEYGVQVFWDLRVAVENMTQASPEIRKLEEEIQGKPRGLAYMYRQRLESLIRREVEAEAGRRFQDLYPRIRKHADDVRMEKTKPAEPGWQMLLKLSCLLPRHRYPELGEELDRMAQMEGISVRSTGPWPPYSFAGEA